MAIHKLIEAYEEDSNIEREICCEGGGDKTDGGH